MEMRGVFVMPKRLATVLSIAVFLSGLIGFGRGYTISQPTYQLAQNNLNTLTQTVQSLQRGQSFANAWYVMTP